MSNNGKTVKLSKETLDIIESFRKDLINNDERETMKLYFRDLSYDKLIRLAICDGYYPLP